jgi:hypothetical protein
MPAPLVWHYSDTNIEFGNLFPYLAASGGTGTSDDVTDFRVSGKAIKTFLAKRPKYSHTIHLKVNMTDVEKIKEIVIAAPESQIAKSLLSKLRSC